MIKRYKSGPCNDVAKRKEKLFEPRLSAKKVPLS